MLKKLLQFSIGSFAAAAVSFFTTPVVTYFVIPEYFGIATLFSTIATFLFPIINFGTDQAFMRFFYEKEGNERYALLWSCLFPCCCIFIFLCTVLLIFSHRVALYFFDKDIPYLVVLLCVDLFFRLIQRYSILTIRMQQKALLFSLLNFFLSIINTATIIIYSLCFEKSYLAIIYGGIISNLVLSVIAIFIERKFWFSKFKITGVDIKNVLFYAIPLVAAHFLSTLFDGIDKYCLKQFSTFYELGLYSVSFKVIAALRLIQSGFSMYRTPAAFEHYEKHKDTKVGGIYIDGKLEAFTFADMLKDDTVCVHLEKANPEIKGLYPAINKIFLCEEFEDVKFVNREDDLGLENLRKAKLSYNPVELVEKYVIIEK